jgi:tRNA modification GTPase
MFSPSDTIVAIATPPGLGGIGVVRVSGSDARAIGAAILADGSPLAPRHATYTRVVGGKGQDGAPIDRVVATFFPGPHSYTGEDVLEISAHGSAPVLEAIVGAAMSEGARLAEPGEFTLRAFLNGRIDLVQAEAVADLVNAVTPLQARAAFDQLEGTLTGAIASIDAAVFDLVARLEASVDFPGEGYHFIEASEVAAALQRVRGEIDRLLADASRGRIVREGRQVVIAGKPNVGKSSLFNHLAGAARAIVTEIPGTTRDLVSETIDIGGVRVCLVDTAGQRVPADAVEAQGVTRAVGAASVADLVVVVLDRSAPLSEEDAMVLQRTARAARMIVANKCDLPAAWEGGAPGVGAVMDVSLKTGAGASEMKQALGDALLLGRASRDVPGITNARHIALMERAGSAVTRAAAALEASGGGLAEEFVLADLQEARAAIEEVTGKRTTEDVLQEIFSRFCIGK